MSSKRPSISKPRTQGAVVTDSSTTMLGQASVATTAGTTPNTKPSSSRHSSSTSGGAGASGLGGFGGGAHYLIPTEDAVKRLNLETRNQESVRRGRTQEKIEQQVDEFLSGLDKAARSQLSKTQLIKSLEKVSKWSSENKKYLVASKTVTKEWLDLDLDPAEWSDKKPIPTPTPQTAPASTSTSTSSASTSTSSSSSALGALPSSRFPMFSSYAPRQQEVQFQLTGAIYERERAPKAPTTANQDIAGRRAVKMKEWLVRRGGKQMDRDSIRKWIAGTAKNQNLLPEDVLKMYARKRRDLSSNELQQLLDMPVRPTSHFPLCAHYSLPPFHAIFTAILCSISIKKNR
jgi:hypothetical protein